MTKIPAVPQHVAIIMDGNGRWAAKRGLPKIMGHRAGVKSARSAMECAQELGIKVLTLYTFSTENWKRPESEVNALFKLLENYLDSEGDKLLKNNIQFRVIGRLHQLPDSLRKRLDEQVSKTKHSSGLILNLALNYGGRSEIVDAVRSITVKVRDGALRADDIDESVFAEHLYTRGLPDPDLVIRTSGESRISNFLIWQLAYAEICIVKKLWPDFKKEDFRKAIAEYQNRQRRFGG